MIEVQEQIFECLRDVAEFANNNRLNGLQAAVDRAEEVAIMEVLGIDLTTPIEIEDYANAMKEIMPYFGEESAALARTSSPISIGKFQSSGGRD